MSVRVALPKLVAIAALAAVAAVAAPSAAVAYGGHHPQLPSSLSKLQAGTAAVGLVGPRASWLSASEETHG